MRENGVEYQTNWRLNQRRLYICIHKMTTTNKANWVNGHQIRGGWFNTLTISFLNIGIMFIWGINQQKHRFVYDHKKTVCDVKFYKLK